MEPWPDDPQDWTDEQWLAWLDETDEPPAPPPPPEEIFPPPTRPRGLSGQMLAAAMTGMAEAIYGPREKPAIVIEAAGGPPEDNGLDLTLDFDHPEESVVVIRPWLLDKNRTV
ncbi:MAG: hypothetical protein ACRD1K_02660 [Acidimicrobiales bacterium]